LVVGDPVWRELPVRDGLHNSYDKLWELAVNTVLENNFDIATMDRDSGYVRTAWNEGVAALGGSWFYKVQVSLKFVVESGEAKSTGGRSVSKIGLQAAGEVSKVTARV
jgi:uncharacterized lipoprotein